MTSDRKHPSAAFWLTVALVVVLAGYPLSMGPACWLVNQKRADVVMVARIYRPLVRMACSESVLASPLRWYGDLDRPTDTPTTTVPMVGWMNLYLSLFDAGEI